MTALQLQFLMMFFAGWVNRSQQDVIEYLQRENRVLRELELMPGSWLIRPVPREGLGS